MEALQEDTGDSSMQCTEHPFKNNTPAGGICPLCLQEKLGKLVSSSFPITIFPSSSSSSPSFTSDVTTTTTTTNTTTTTTTTTTKCHHQDYSNNRILYLIGQKKKKKKDLNIIINGGDQNKNLVFKRSKSTATPRRNLHYMEPENDDGLMSQHKRGFWSFIHLQKYSHSSSSINNNNNNNNNNKNTLTDISSNTLCASQQEREIIESPCHNSFDRKVSRSRSVGCGSRSFSGDFFERISTGLGDCALRRVESQRAGTRSGGHDCINERVRCGGLFSGFMITSSSSSSSSSYWIASNPNKSDVINTAGKVTSAMAGTDHGRSRSWGWALASPMRVFSKPSKPSSSKREGSIKNPSPNLGAVPSLLSVRS